MEKDHREKLVTLIRDVLAGEGGLVAELVDERLAHQEEERKAAEAKNEPPPNLLTKAKSEAEERRILAEQRGDKGVVVGQMVRAFLAAGGKVDGAIAIAEKRYGSDSDCVRAFRESREKALSSEIDSAGGFLVEGARAADVIELLRPASVVRRFNPRIAPLSGTLTMPKQTAGVAGTYLGENAPIPVEELAVGELTATAKKLASITPVSNDLIRRSSPSADALVRDDMVAALATTSDIAFIRNVGASAAPKGLKYWAATANQLDATGHDPAAVNIDDVTSDLGRMLQALGDANVAMLNLGMIIEWRTWRYLATARDGNGNLVWAPEMSNGTIMSVPFARTSQIPRNLDASGTAAFDETEIYLADFADVILAEEEAIMFTASDVAAYEESGNTRAAFSRDQTVIRAIQKHDLIARHGESIVTLEQVVWGA